MTPRQRRLLPDTPLSADTRNSVPRIPAAGVGLLCLLAAGCCSDYVTYQAKQYDAAGNVTQTIDGSLHRRSLLTKSRIPPFAIGPTNAAIITTSGTIDTQGDTELLSKAVQAAVKGGVQAAVGK